MTTVTSPVTQPGPTLAIYVDFPTASAPKVRSTASVPYPTLFGALGISSATLKLNAASECRGDTAHESTGRLLRGPERRQRGEFALVLPLLLLFLLGTDRCRPLHVGI